MVKLDKSSGAEAAPPQSVPAKSDDRVSQLAFRLIAANARLNALAMVTAFALIVLGVWMYVGVKDSLREIRASGLQSVLDAEVEALEVWLNDRRAALSLWAGEPEVQRDIEALLVLAHEKRASPEALWNARERVHLESLLAPGLKQTGAIAFNVIDPNGLIVATQAREYAGRRINPGPFLVHLSAVFRGNAQFIRPYLEHDRIAGLERPAFTRPVIWFDAPVRNAAGEVVAALGFAHYADAQFAHILNAAQPGRTGEVYAFDPGGTMVSESRFVPLLRKLALVPDAGASAILRVQIRDPGGDLAAGHEPALELAARPYTQLVALALAARGKTDAGERRGQVLEPYRNYRGVEVVGAWRWLAEHDLGMAIEMEASEAYAPMRYLTLAFGIVLTLLTIALLAVAWSALVVRRLKREVGDARMLGQYRLEREIGEGGMGRVFLARHALLKRPTAVKMLKPHMATDEIVARFEREVQLASQLLHPNTVEVYDYGRTREGVFYYVMEYLEGETLDKIVSQHGAMPIARALHVLKQICAALRVAHGRSLVHRDVKPHNIMLCRRGGEYDVVKILDFGLVKDTDRGQSRDLTQYQRVLGTPRYMAPERIRNAADADARSDIYSVGAVAYFLVTGRELFDGAEEHDLTYQVLHTTAPRPSEAGAEVPRRFDDLVARCLAKERTERPHDIVVVLALLEALAVDHPWSQQQAASSSLWTNERTEGNQGFPP
jgi:serine/threonine-protein kinase